LFKAEPRPSGTVISNPAEIVMYNSDIVLSVDNLYFIGKLNGQRGYADILTAVVNADPERSKFVPS
jgi:hypothetical protein